MNIEQLKEGNSMEIYDITLKIYKQEMDKMYKDNNASGHNRCYGKIVGYLQCLLDLSIINYDEYLIFKNKYTN